MPERPTLQIQFAMNRVKMSFLSLVVVVVAWWSLSCCLLPLVSLCVCSYVYIRRRASVYHFVSCNYKAMLSCLPCKSTSAAESVLQLGLLLRLTVAFPSVQAQASETLITNRWCSESRIPLSGYSAWAMNCLTWILQASWKTPRAALLAHW